ncbi:MAG: ABC transporter substrate-binding protein [Desulfarculaceae bacterium]|nr:ABC transporter substrate-binding protein [Desulfarculaceae bacterium]MCF8074429.1 ABC transporter substrate-binding protein [Desulfarculaceae bacterium]MCF8102731.1 ABC transporter substrate-binding protein [Desulfarculaceae bacterium]MCF8116414.1 ABC transporter substrate-binding protein [Desulfarculaceae bacterium]
MSRKWMIIATCLVAFSMLLAVPGVGAAADKVKIGLMFGLTGPASPIGPVQMKGAQMAIDEVNAAGGIKLNGKQVMIEAVVKDDETKGDVAVRRFKELRNEDKVAGIVGSTFAGIAKALNNQVRRMPIPYISACVAPMDMFEKGKLAPTTFGIHGTAYSIGFSGAAYIATKLKLKKVYFLAPAYSFGRDQYKGAKAAFDKYGVEVIYDEAPVKTADYTPYIQKIAQAKPDICMMAQWGTGAIQVLKQAHELGLKKDTKIWFNWMTNVFGSGVPAEALEGVYSLMSWYWNLEGFADKAVIAEGKAFVDKYTKVYGDPPDPYAGMAYVGCKELIRGIEQAQSTDPMKIAKAIMANPTFPSMKGPGTWRIDHQPVFKYGAFVVQGKSPADRKGKWDLVKVIGAYTGDDYLPPLKTEGY